MLGRELIIYILENGLENENVMSKEFFKAFPTIETVAVAFNVGTATVEVWLDNHCLEGIEFDGVTYIFPNSLDKFAEKMGRKEDSDV